MANHQEFLDALVLQEFSLTQHFTDRAAHQRTTQLRNDAESAIVVTTFTDLQIGVMLGRQLETGRRHEIESRIVRLRKVLVHQLIDEIKFARTRHPQNLRAMSQHVVFTRQRFARTQTARDDHATVFCQRFTDGFDALGHGFVQEAARIDDHQIGIVVRADQTIAFRTQTRHDDFRVHERLRATHGNETDRRDSMHSVIPSSKSSWHDDPSRRHDDSCRKVRHSRTWSAWHRPRQPPPRPLEPKLEALTWRDLPNTYRLRRP